MVQFRETLELIIKNVSLIKVQEIKRVLILYDEEVKLIGDFCVRFNKLKYFKEFLNNTIVDLNFSPVGSDQIFDCLLKNNPHISKTSRHLWPDIDFSVYDMIFFAGHNEHKFLGFLHVQLNRVDTTQAHQPAVFSLSAVMLAPVRDSNSCFPVHTQLINYLKAPRVGELYLTRDERDWGNEWLRSHGLREKERVFIILDSASRRDKLIGINVYFDLLEYLFKMQGIKVLIFDENKLGKEEFYKAWLGQENTDKFIFSTGLDLRQALCILGSDYTSMIFGPCTGLMHCASSIYNYVVTDGLNAGNVPLMITYTGKYFEGEKNANSWWGSSPLVNCLLVRKTNYGKKMVELCNLDEEQKNANDSLPANEYTSDMLTEFIDARLSSPSY